MPHKAELERTKQELAQALAEIDKIGNCSKDIVSRDLLPLSFLSSQTDMRLASTLQKLRSVVPDLLFLGQISVTAFYIHVI